MADKSFLHPPTLFRYGMVVFAHVLGVFWALVFIAKNLITCLKNPVAFFTVKTRTPPAVLQARDLGEHGYLHLKNNIRIHYVAGGPENAPLMLFLHGFPDFWYSWRHQLRHFQGRYRVVAIDMPGYGDSSKPSGLDSYEVTQLVEDVRLVIEGLGRKSCILVGHDWGGILAWSFASTYPEMVQQMIVLNAPHPAVFWKFAMKNLKQMLMSWYIFLFQLPFLPEIILRRLDLQMIDDILSKSPMGAKPGSFTPEDIEAYKYTFGTPGAFTPPVNYYRNRFRFREPKKINYHSLPFPILVIFGTGDRAISPETALLSGQFAGGVFELKYVEGASHWVQHEVPGVVNETMDSFLAQQR